MVELIYDRDCPNVPEVRANLRRACEHAGIAPDWLEWERSASTSPAYVVQFGSPTVLVDGRDVAGAEPTEGAVSCCRVYCGARGDLARSPSVELITAALVPSGASAKLCAPGRWPSTLLAFPGAVVSVLPFGGCPACWPVYASVLSALGLNFLLSREYLLPVMVLFLVFAVAALFAKRRRGYGPVGAGLTGAALVLIGKFVLASGAVTYVGAAVLVVAAVWNAWPQREAAPCPKCVPSHNGLVQLSAKEKSL